MSTARPPRGEFSHPRATLNESCGEESGDLTNASLASSSSKSPIEGPSAAPDGRTKLLRRVAEQEQPPIIIVAGLSGAGKTTLISFLGDLGIESAERLLPRPRRGDDTPGDKTWVKESRPGPHGTPVDLSSAGSVIWSDHKYTGYIGFRGMPLIKRLVKDSDCEGIAVILGRGTEIAPAIEAFQRIIPTQPVVVIRVDAPTAVIAARLQDRPGATAQEREARLQKLEPMAREDAPQLEPLARAWGLTSILNITEAELHRIGLSPQQVQPATKPNLHAWVKAAIDAEKARSAAVATDIMTPRTIDYGNRFIPDSVLDVLENVLVPTFERAHDTETASYRWLLKGGLAVALYLPESRPVSPDIDFAVPNNPQAERFLGDVIGAILGAEMKFTPASPKPVYHDRKFYGEVISRGFEEKVELDALSATRIQPDERSFCYTFDLDSYLEFHRRTVQLPNGRTVDLCPPEQIITEKLIAGRGVELNKFDLFDSAGLLAKVPTQPALFRRLLEIQEFDPKCDAAVEQRLGQWSLMQTTDALTALGFDAGDPLVQIVASKIPSTIISGKPAEMPSAERAMTLNELKRFCMAHRAITSLDRILESLDTPVQAGDEVTSIAHRFGRAAVSQRVAELKLQLVHYLEYELGARDIFVRRDPQQSKVIAPMYFSELEAQRERSTKVS